MAETSKWTPEEEAAVDELIGRGPELMRERLLMMERRRLDREARQAHRRARLRRLSFGLLGR